MTETTFVTDDIARAGQQMQAVSDQIRGIAAKVTPPDTAMYGLLVSEAAKMTEPQASEQHKEFLDALTATVAEVAQKLGDTARQYQETEDQNTSLADKILGMDESITHGGSKGLPQKPGGAAPGDGWGRGGGTDRPPTGPIRDYGPEPGHAYPMSTTGTVPSPGGPSPSPGPVPSSGEGWGPGGPGDRSQFYNSGPIGDFGMPSQPGRAYPMSTPSTDQEPR